MKMLHINGILSAQSFYSAVISKYCYALLIKLCLLKYRLESHKRTKKVKTFVVLLLCHICILYFTEREEETKKEQ